MFGRGGRPDGRAAVPRGSVAGRSADRLRAAAGPLDKVEVRVWLPENVTVVRRAVVNPFNRKQVEQAHGQEAARLGGFAAVGANSFGVNAVDYPTLGRALKEFAAKSGHKELEHLPLCFIGMSAGAGMSVKFAELMPERTPAVAAVCLEAGPRSEATRKVPTLTAFGEKGGKQMQQLAEKLPAERKAGALWGTAVQWGRGHEFGAANNLVMPFFDAVIRRRYPADATPAAGPVKLRDFPEAEGWLGDRATWDGRRPEARPVADYRGEKAEACRLPGADVAAVWRAFVVKSPTVKITAPAGLGDGRKFAARAAGEPLAVTVEDGGSGAALYSRGVGVVARARRADHGAGRGVLAVPQGQGAVGQDEVPGAAGATDALR